MIFGTTEKMGEDILKMTTEIAGRIAASGMGNTSPVHAAKMARHVMAELLGLKSLNFELTQTAFVVNGIEVTVELKDEPNSRFEYQALHGKPAARKMVDLAAGGPSLEIDGPHLERSQRWHGPDPEDLGSIDGY